MSLNLSISRLGLGGGRGNPPPFNISFTGLSADSLGTYGQVGNHAAISYTITPDLTTETIKWSNSSNPADAATFGTGASPTDFTSVDGFSVYLHVTDDPVDSPDVGPVTRTFSFSARKAPATGGTDLDLSFVEDSAISSTDLLANWTANGNTLTLVSVVPPAPTGLSVSSSGTMTGTPTTTAADTAYTITMQDEYGRQTSDVFTLEITAASADPVLTLVADNLDQDPPEYTLNSDTAGTLRWDFHTSATPPAAGAGDIATGTETIVSGDNTITLDLSAYAGDTGYLHFRITTSNILTSQQITVPSGFDPASLFAASEEGAWYDPSDLSTLWQDTAGTTPVTADGQAVARMDDKSGNGNHLTQSTAANRPLYKTNGTLHWLAFDGTNDALISTSALVTPGTDKAQVFAGARKLSDAAVGIIAEMTGNYSSSNGTFAMYNQTTAGWGYNVRGSIVSDLSVTTGYTAPITNVLTGLTDVAGDSSILRVNGSQVASSTADLGAANFGSHTLYVGARSGNSLRFNGNLYGLIIRFGANLTTEIADAESWIAAKSGVTL